MASPAASFAYRALDSEEADSFRLLSFLLGDDNAPYRVHPNAHKANEPDRAIRGSVLCLGGSNSKQRNRTEWLVVSYYAQSRTSAS